MRRFSLKDSASPCPFFVAGCASTLGMAAEGSHVDPGIAAPAPSSGGPAPPPPAPKRKRAQLPRIDLDRTIEEAKAAMKAANKAMSDARALAKNERRKKARLLKKAATLSPGDLERIAVLKRCGLWDPNLSGGPPADAEVCIASTASSGSPAKSRAASPVAAASSAASSCGSPTPKPAGGTPLATEPHDVGDAGGDLLEQGARDEGESDRDHMG